MEKVAVRNATFEDEQLVNNLCQRNALSGEISPQAWNWIWKDNAYYSETWPIGWVLESNNIIVGYIGNIPRAYSLNGDTWIAGVARSFVVDEEFRRYSLKLLSKFFQQKEADLLIFSSANNLSSSIYKMVKAKPIPQDSFDTDLFWIVSPLSFIYSLLRKKRVPKSLSLLISYLIAPFFMFENLVRNRWPKGENFDVEISIPKKLTTGIDKLWHQIKANNPNKLLSYRDRDSILWQYDNDSAKNRNPLIFTLMKNNEMLGYLIAVEMNSIEYDLKRIVIDDLIVYDNDATSIVFLVKEAFLYAQKNDVDILQFTGFPENIRDALKLTKPFSRKYSYSRFWYYVLNKDLEKPLKKKSTWYASLFDGDSSI